VAKVSASATRLPDLALEAPAKSRTPPCRWHRRQPSATSTRRSSSNRLAGRALSRLSGVGPGRTARRGKRPPSRGPRRKHRIRGAPVAPQLFAGSLQIACTARGKAAQDSGGLGVELVYFFIRMHFAPRPPLFSRSGSAQDDALPIFHPSNGIIWIWNTLRTAAWVSSALETLFASREPRCGLTHVWSVSYCLSSFERGVRAGSNATSGTKMSPSSPCHVLPRNHDCVG